jgi:hypothetical protein
MAETLTQRDIEGVNERMRFLAICRPPRKPMIQNRPWGLSAIDFATAVVTPHLLLLRPSRQIIRRPRPQQPPHDPIAEAARREGGSGNQYRISNDCRQS